MLASFILTSVFLQLVSAISDNTNVALYWGQNSAGSQTKLASYCESESADIYILSFIDSFGVDTLNVNFANACSDTYSDGTLHCSTIASDIKKCQSLGKTVLLSMGGASGAYGFSDDAAAKDFAKTLWNTFGAGSDDSVERPFDDAIVDGFDFDIENNNPTGYAALATELRNYFKEDTSKTYYLSAAPQCPYPDASVGDLMSNADLDFAFIQFYNNYCSTLGTNFNWDTWADYAKNVSPNKDIKLFLGLPSAPGAAGSGYATVDEIKSTFDNYILNKEDSNFGGFVLWDASWSQSNQVNGESFGNNLQEILDDAYSGQSSSSSSTLATSASTFEALTSSSATLETSITSSAPTTQPVPQTSTSSTSSSITSEVPTTETTSAEQQEPMSSLGEPGPAVTYSPTTLVTYTTSQDLSLPTATSQNKGQSGSSSNTSAKDCSDLSGLAKAKCLNANFQNGLYSGQSSCTEGDIACDANGGFAMCNFGEWVTTQCAAGTTCYAYNNDDAVTVGCNYIDTKNNFEKRSEGGFFSLFKRHVHHQH